jgi:hypothetical protein
MNNSLGLIIGVVEEYSIIGMSGEVFSIWNKVSAVPVWNKTAEVVSRR